jgi:hypothetical protein
LIGSVTEARKTSSSFFLSSSPGKAKGNLIHTKLRSLRASLRSDARSTFQQLPYANKKTFGKMIRSAAALLVVAALVGCAVAQDDAPSAAHLVVHKVRDARGAITTPSAEPPAFIHRHHPAGLSDALSLGGDRSFGGGRRRSFLSFAFCAS